jgi:hypothetical protein
VILIQQNSTRLYALAKQNSNAIPIIKIEQDQCHVKEIWQRSIRQADQYAQLPKNRATSANYLGTSRGADV